MACRLQENKECTIILTLMKIGKIMIMTYYADSKVLTRLVAHLFISLRFIERCDSTTKTLFLNLSYRKLVLASGKS